MRWVAWLFSIALLIVGCGPKPPPVILESPKGFPEKCGTRKLYHTPQAYIYARSDIAAGEADAWVKDIRDYIQRNYQRELGKGVVIVMDPADEPLARTLEEELAIERDPAVMPTPPRKPKTVAEIRRKLAEQGVPEAPTVRGTTIPLSPEALRRPSLSRSAPINGPKQDPELPASQNETTTKDAAPSPGYADSPDWPALSWAVAAPSHELAKECGIEVGMAALQKKRPDVPPEKIRQAVSMLSDSLAKMFELVRGEPVFVLWVQQQQDWSDDRKREVIRERIRYVFRSHWMPVPKDEDLEW